MRFCPDDASTLRAVDDGGDLIGQVIADRYEVTSLLGEGGMGRVYVAKHVRLPQQVAIKVLHPAMVKDAGAVARFNREAANAARIEHDRVARVFDFGETGGGAVYLAMEFVAGHTLRTVLTEESPLSPVRAANIVYQIADGLEAAHRLQIVHRDLKPDNILVANDGAHGDRVKIVDFGIAKALDGRDSKLTQTGMSVGTPEFMSPEQLFGEEVDARTDVYSLALVAFQCFTGTLPFVSTTPERAMTARIASKPKTLAELRPSVAWPAELQAAFDGALASEPTDRTASALAFGEAVVAAVEAWTGQSVLRGRTPLSSTAIPAPAPRPTPAAVPAAPTPAAATPPPPVPGARRPRWIVPVALVVVAAVGGAMMLRSGPSAPPASPAAAVADSAQTAPAVGGGSTTPSVTQQDANVTSKASDGRQPGNPASTGGQATPPASAPAPTSPTVAQARSTDPGAEAADARRQLDAIRAELSADAADEATARTAIPRLEVLLGRLGNATDSTWAYLALVGAHGMAGSPLKACGPLRRAKALASTPSQERMVQAFIESGQLMCAP